MLLQSHIYLGNQLSRLIDTKYRKYFVMGNVTPDMAPEHKIKKHEYYYLKDWFLNYVDNTMEMKLGDKKLAYYRLGVVTHYLADFFCRAHNDASIKKRYVKHFSYEKRLHDDLKKCNPVQDVSLSIPLFNIDTFLEVNHSRYLQDEYQIENDLEFISNITSGVVNTANEYILKNSSQKVFYPKTVFKKYFTL